MGRLKTRLLGSGIAALAISLAVPVHAQTITPTPETDAAQDGGDEGAITVTGTRIQQPGLVSNSPITAVDSAEIRFQGATNVESVINRLPQVTADANENVSNGSDGTARLNLRNLGSNRNLILINGQRLLPVQASDVNFIPSSLIERIDVVTGGASAVYGSDAISGVVNFILRDNLQGVRADVQYGFSNHRNDNQDRRDLISANRYRNASHSPVDGQRLDVNLAAGTNFAGGRGNITAYFGYREVQPILQSDRDVSACALDPTFTGDTATGFTCGGSSNNEFGLFQPLTGPRAGLPALNNTRDGERTWVPYNPTFRYNYAPDNYFQRNDTRYTAGAFAKFEVDSAAELYTSFMFMDDRTNSQVAPSALFQGRNYTINCNNPFLSAQQGNLLCGSAFGTGATQDLFIGYRPVAGNARPRRDDLRHTDYRVTGGVRGEIATGIRYDVNGLFSSVLFRENYQNDIDPARANRGLQVVNVSGTPTCTSVIDGTDPDCVPLDVFRYNGISDEAFAYIYAPTFTRGLDQETVLTGTVSADLTSYGVQSPWANNGIGLVFGVEHRRETLKFRADALAQSKGTKEADGRFNVTEFFTEVRLPIFEDKPFAEELTLTGGYRYSKYSTRDEGISTYKGEVAYAPIRDIRLRASYNRAIRAPNISELFAAQQLGNVGGAQDPCAGPTPAATLAQCALTGVTPAQYGFIIDCPAETCVTQGGGNPALRPEEADTYTAGIVLSPTFLRGFSLSVDYFDIKVRDYISSIPASLTISQCFQTGDPFFCSLFNRDPQSGVIFGDRGYIISTTQNTGSLKTSGLDIGANYSLSTGIGGFSASFIGTWLKELRNEPLPGLGSYDCKGLFGPTCGQPSPEWRHQARLTYTSADDVASISLNWRYIGGTKLTNNNDNPFLAGTPYEINARLPVYNYFDLAVSAEVQKGISFRAGVNNLLDKDPPAIAQGLLALFGNGNTYPGTYDVAGRTFFFGFTGEF